MGLRCRNPPRHLSQLKARKIPLIETPSGQELCRPQYNVHGIFIETPLHKKYFKYQSWYLTPYCGLEVQKLTQPLKSVKGPENTIDWNTKWTRTLPSFDIFAWVIYRNPQYPNIKVVFGDSSWHISGEQSGAGQYAWAAGSDVTGNGPDRKWRHMKSRDRKLRYNRMYVLRIPALFSYYSSSTKCTIAHYRK